MTPEEHVLPDTLLELAYGELAPSQAAPVEAHLRGCVRCARALAEIQGVRKAMSPLASQRAPEAGLESLVAYARQGARRTAAPPRPNRWRRMLLPLSSAAALVVAGVVANRVLREVHPDPLQLAARPGPSEAKEAVPAEPSLPASAPQAQPVEEKPSGSAMPSAPPKAKRSDVERRAQAAKSAPGELAADSPAPAPLAAAPNPMSERVGAAGAPMALRPAAEPQGGASESARSGALRTRPAQIEALSREAREAHAQGNLEREAALLRQAIAIRPARAVLEGLLERLCAAETALGEGSGASCQRLAREYPDSAAARAAAQQSPTSDVPSRPRMGPAPPEPVPPVESPGSQPH